MSGVSGSDRISRAHFSKVLEDYKKLIANFPGYKSVEPSGSFNSDMTRDDFGDMDLILHIETDKSKKEVKKDLVKWFTAMSDDVVVPFTSERYAGRKTYNSGEIVTINYPQKIDNLTVQIDNIIALDDVEADFKKDFLDMPAQKQGLILGLMKVVLIENKPVEVFSKVGIDYPTELDEAQEFEFNLSSSEIQLRKVTYIEPGSFKQKGREVVWSSRDWKVLEKILWQYDLSKGFDELLVDIKKNLRNPRSSRRMAGVFSSMISVKTGEMGTPKGDAKQVALDKVQTMFGESFNSFKQYYKEFKRGQNEL
jgi:hypothetical protein